MMFRPLWTLAIPEIHIKKLKEFGCEYAEDIDMVLPTQHEDIKSMVLETKELRKSKSIHVMSTLQIHKNGLSLRNNIVTFSKAVDDILGGGIPTGRITELNGAPGSGKTQICLQACISVQIPKHFGCLAGSAVYIETNNNFSIKRLREIYLASASHCSKLAKEKKLSNEGSNEINEFMLKNPMENITKYSVQTPLEFKCCFLVIKKKLENGANIRLIVIDSFTFPFYQIDTSLEKTKLVSEIICSFNVLSKRYKIAILLSNDLTTCVLNTGNIEIIPSLGESFGHIIHNRIMLGKKPDHTSYTAILQKSNQFPYAAADYQITTSGIRDLPLS